MKGICALIDFGNSDKITGKHIRDAIEAHKIEALCGGNLFENNLPILEKWTTPSWISHTWKYTKEDSIIFQEETYSLQPQRFNDSLIMEDWIKFGFKGNELSELNRCQMYLNFTCLSDVSTGDGLRIPPSSWKGTQRKKEELYLCSFQQKPPNRSWKNWQTALQLHYELARNLAFPCHIRLGN